MQRHPGHCRSPVVVLPLDRLDRGGDLRAHSRARDRTPSRLAARRSVRPSSARPSAPSATTASIETWTGGAARARCCSRPRAASVARRLFKGGRHAARRAVHARRRSATDSRSRGAFPTREDKSIASTTRSGSRRIQHYLTTLPDGRIVVLPPTWDVERREWIPQPRHRQPRRGDAESRSRSGTATVSAATSRDKTKGYDAALARYDTRWTDFGTSCERCHGPGAAHAASYAAGQPHGVGAPWRWSCRRRSRRHDRR